MLNILAAVKRKSVPKNYNEQKFNKIEIINSGIINFYKEIVNNQFYGKNFTKMLITPIEARELDVKLAHKEYINLQNYIDKFLMKGGDSKQFLAKDITRSGLK